MINLLSFFLLAIFFNFSKSLLRESTPNFILTYLFIGGCSSLFKYIELKEAESAIELYFENIKKTLETKSIIK